MVQRDLFGKIPKPKHTVEENFRLWVVAHERVIDIFLRFAREARDRGKKKIGIGFLTERVRWEVYFEKDDRRIQDQQ